MYDTETVTEKTYKVLSFGSGVQSTALLLMSCKGILPKLDCAIFADVGWEPRSVYETLEWATEEAAKHDIPLHVVKQTTKGLRHDVVSNMAKVDGKRFSSPPLFTKAKDGTLGMIRRQCTVDYKIRPLVRHLRENLLGLERGQRVPKGIQVEQWMGITQDEVTRAKPSEHKWITHVFPFISWHCDYLGGKNWHRHHCVNWLAENYPDAKIGRSACIGCPYHSNEEWRNIRDNPDEWADAVEFDRSIRHDHRTCKGSINEEMFVHRSCVPLDQVDLRTDKDKGQPDLWDNACDGMCGF